MQKQHPFEQSLQFVARHYRKGALDPDQAWKQFATTHSVAPRRRWWSYAGAIAAGVLLLIGLAIGWEWQRRSPDWVTFTLPLGNTQQITLPDQSQITLAGGSTLRFDRKRFGQKRREVQLQGKALFEVNRDTLHPFSVEAGTTEVTVLGTSFQVAQSTTGETSVQVVSGHVRFEAEQQEVILTAGQRGDYHPTRHELTTQAVPETDNALAWKTGILVFHNTPLSQVIADLEDCYQTQIQQLHSKATDVTKRLTVTFQQQSLEEVLIVVNQTLDVQLVTHTE